MKLVTTGIQGCGKGTQARILVEKYGYTLLEMGNEFRRVMDSGTELGNKVKELMNAGYQIPGELGIEIMESVINNNIDKDNIIFDAFIRNDRNKEIFDRILPDYKVIFFDLSVEKAKKRILGRMFDKSSGETFPSGTVINPNTGSELVKRDDDKDEKAILKRISEYEEKTLPIVEIQRNEGKIIDINADQSVENVASEIANKLNLK